MRRLAAFGRRVHGARPVIQVLTLGEPQTGLWCPYCLLPSVIRHPWMSQFGPGPLVPWPYEHPVDVCDDCGRVFGPGEVQG